MHPNCKIFVRKLSEIDKETLLADPFKIIKFYPTLNLDEATTLYDEVYTLINESLLTQPYKFRVFFFIDILLSSTKLPAYIVASYIKKLCHISLKAKVKSLVCIIKIVGNALIRHPTLIFLRDRVDQRAREIETTTDTCTLQSWAEWDPFKPEETNIKLTRALDSCIWEILPQRFHRHRQVSKNAVAVCELKFNDMEFQLDKYIC